MAYNLGTAQGRIIVDGSGAQKGFGVATVAANAFFGAIQAKLDSVRQLGDNLTKLGAVGSAGLGVAVKAAADFEAGLSAIRAVSGATNEEMDGIRETALRLGKDTAFSATEAAFAMEALIKAGVSTQDVMTGAADATVNLAAAGGVDLVTAAEIAANALNQFNLEGKDMGQVADLIAGAANASAIDVTDFGFSLSQAGAVASLTGLKFDDLAVAIAEMGQAGIKGSDAGTSIKTFLTNLIPTMDKQIAKFQELGLITLDLGTGFQKMSELGIKPAGKSLADVQEALQKYIEKTGGAKVGTEANAKAATELGMEVGVLKNQFFDAQGNIKSFAEIQQVLQDALKGMTREQKLATLEMLFGSDAIRAASVFAEQGADGFNKMADAMGKVSAADVAATRLDNLKGSLEQLKGSFETALITIGEVFLPLVRAVVDGITAMINVFNNLPAPVQKTIAIFLGLGSATALLTGLLIKLSFILVPLLAKFLGLVAIRQIFSIFTTGFAALRGGAGVMAALGVAFSRAGVVFTRFAKVGKFLLALLVRFPKVMGALRLLGALAFGPWGVAIAAAVAAIVWAYNKFDGFRELIQNIGRVIKESFIASINGIKAAWEAVVAGFSGATGTGIIGFFNSVGAAARVFWEALRELGTIFMTNVMPALREAGGQILTALREGWTELSNTFRTSVVPALQQIVTAFQSALPAMRQLWTALQPILEVLVKVAGVIVGVLLVALFQWMKFMIGEVLPILIQVGTFMVVHLIQNLTKIAQVVAVVIGWLVQWVATITGAIVPALQLWWSVFSTTWNAILNVVTTVITAIWNVIKSYVGFITAFWSTAWDIFGPIITRVFTLVKLIIQTVLTAILVLITNQINMVISIWRNGWTIVKAIVEAVWRFIGPFVTSVLQTMLRGITATWNAIKAVTQAAWNLVQKYIIDPLRRAVSSVTSETGRARNVISSAWNAVKSITLAAWRFFYSTIQTQVQAAARIISNIRNVVTGAFSGAAGWLIDAGRRIIQGLLNGLDWGISQVRSKLDYLTGLIPDWKGPKERDAELLTENGQLIIRSLIAGFQKEIPALRRELGDITNLIPSQAPTSAQQAAASSRPTGSDRVAQLALDSLRGQVGTIVNNHWNVYNPVAEKTSVTATREATRRAALGFTS